MKVRKIAYVCTMNYEEGKQKIIQAWGILGSSWGINKTMAQIHALLMISPEALSTEEIMEDLNISRGNANMNIRALLDWGIAYKEFKPGERKEYFKSEKDVWSLATQVTKERRKRELEPILKVLKDVQNVENGDSPEIKEFKKITKDLKNFAEKSDKILNKFVESEGNWFFNKLIKFIT